ncbi:protein CEBPZOS-like [Anneissia japonica]|uniref:protein CEBPZOS-like n=1 Tax=Anneissia japonica TaxID=1529436 RepID=UPI001425B374|nr:protein CEBPZOS-like [Anneissia japonica]XP_033102456.1 protein CEBPZOS-like [Anneissia japonica]XP_033102457.1 protein CEBPZOS-like [Anneissia japonica]XP_033102458.1 protein CEBPZOS-like [Anneissia japonica]
MFGSKRIWNGMKYVIYAELVAVAGGYYVFHKMNTNQDFRKYMHYNYPVVLEVFYKTAEYGGITDARKNDYAQWGQITDSSPES